MKMNFNRADKLCQKDNDKNYKELHNYYTPYGFKDITYQEYFDNYIYMEFEGTKFRIPKEYDKRLSSIYGNYMILPPVDKRKGHVSNAFYLKD